MRQVAHALRSAGVRARQYPVAPKVSGPPSPAFVAMVLTHHVVDVAVALRDWQSGAGKLWSAWKKLDEGAKLAMVRMGKRVMSS